METKTIAKINDVNIVVVNNEEQLIPIKPICELLGIDRKRQQDKIKEHPILSSVGGLSPLTGRDGKQYEMYCLPAKYILAWLLNINPNNVNEESREILIKYQSECYDIIYEYFIGKQRKIVEQNKIEIRLLEELAEYNQQREAANKRISEIKRRLEQLREERLKNEPSLF